MTVSHFRFTVSTSALAVHPLENTAGSKVFVRNTSAEPIALGPLGVTAGTGYLLAGNAAAEFDLGPGLTSSLWAIRDGGVNAAISVLHI